jgi:hypothetical protein
MSMFIWRVTPDEGEPYIVKAGTRDVLAWEREPGNPGRSAQQLQDNFHVANAYWLAHRAAVRAGKFTGSRKEFEASVDLESGSLVEVPAAADGDSDGGDSGDPT